MKLIPTVLLLVLVCGCSSQPAHSSYDPLTQARIRIYNKNLLVHVSGIDMTDGKFYYSASAPAIPNHIIGMPIPKNVDRDSLASFAGNFGYVPYREYAVRANHPLTIASVNLNLSSRTSVAPVLCSPSTIQFVPQAGKDYDFDLISIPFQVPKCNLRLREFVTEGGELTAVPIPYTIKDPNQRIE